MLTAGPGAVCFKVVGREAKTLASTSPLVSFLDTKERWIAGNPVERQHADLLTRYSRWSAFMLPCWGMGRQGGGEAVLLQLGKPQTY